MDQQLLLPNFTTDTGPLEVGRSFFSDIFSEIFDEETQAEFNPLFTIDEVEV